MTMSFASKGCHPVISAAGDRTELLSWYDHLPFANPVVLAAKRAELLAQIEEDRAKALVPTNRKIRVAAAPSPQAAA